MKQGWYVALAVAVQLIVSGCNGGGGGLFGLFSGGDSGSSGSAGDLGSLASGGAGESGSGSVGSSNVATVHNPEPTSLALFGGGLAGLWSWRRRNSRPRPK